MRSFAPTGGLINGLNPLAFTVSTVPLPETRTPLFPSRSSQHASVTATTSRRYDMASSYQPFRISTGLKDLIGKDLITDDFVAIFELVKNSFDAHARTVTLSFSRDSVVITDDGKGMSALDIQNKWLFIAYSAKRDGTEDDDYRHKLRRPPRTYAGAKGVGRFSCDRLGERLALYSRAEGHAVHVLTIDWTDYEQDPKQEFVTIDTELSQVERFPPHLPTAPNGSGTVLVITQLRTNWNRKKLQRLKGELAKLINPFSGDSPDFQIRIVAPAEVSQDRHDEGYNRALTASRSPRVIVNGIVTNPVLDALRGRTTVIRVSLRDNGKILDSILEDRGHLIYHIRELNPYESLHASQLTVEIYYLNRSAKTVFARRMGLPSVQFGSIFLFRNGFRVLPVGAEDDDYFTLNRRKQQGVRRFLGGRDLIGRVAVHGVEGFDEATSRNQGLIRTREVTDLIKCVLDKCVKRLERYVVDITWKDKFDKDVADISRIRRDASSVLVGQLVAQLADTANVEVLEFSKDLVRIIDDKAEAFAASLSTLTTLAERTGDEALLTEMKHARARVKALRKSEAEATAAAEEAAAQAAAAEEAAQAAETKYTAERQRNRFLAAVTSFDQDTILNLHHQILMHAADVQHGIKRMMRALRKDKTVSASAWIDFLERMSFRNSQILTAARFATKKDYRKQATAVTMDLTSYVREYASTIAALWAPRGISVEVHGDDQVAERRFRPIEIGIVLDNLVSNAAKAGARTISFRLKATTGADAALSITVADDGEGWPLSIDPLRQVLEKGVTTTDGSGLGLHHVRQIVEGLGGSISLTRSPDSSDLPGAQLTVRIPT